MLTFCILVGRESYLFVYYSALQIANYTYDITHKVCVTVRDEFSSGLKSGLHANLQGKFVVFCAEKKSWWWWW